MVKNFFFLYLLCFYINNALAIEYTFYPNKLNHCKITKNSLNDYEPEKFQSTNNLLRKTGQKPVYCGTKIIVKGIVLDQNCVPVPDAKVYLWQVGCDGKYPYIPLRTRINKKMLNLANNVSFTGSGTATTNNKGEFYFITIFPYSNPRVKPNVNVRVQHRSLGQLQTKLYFSDNNENDCDEVTPVLINVLDKISTYNFNIVMKGNILKHY